MHADAHPTLSCLAPFPLKNCIISCVFLSAAISCFFWYAVGFGQLLDDDAEADAAAAEPWATATIDRPPIALALADDVGSSAIAPKEVPPALAYPMRIHSATISRPFGGNNHMNVLNGIV